MSFNEQCHTKGYGLTRVNVIQDSRLYTRVKVIQWLRSNNGQDHTQVKVIQGLRSQLDFKSDLALQIFSKKLANEDKRVTFCCI